MDPRTSAQDMMQCALCETAVVQMHCDTCLVNLCKACVGEHFSADLSKPHKIVHFKDKKSTLIHPRCTSHEEETCDVYEETCEMFCTHCDVPICTICLASDQHLGHKLARILEIRDEKRDNLIKKQTELKEKIYPNYQDIASDVQIRMSQLQKEYGDLSTFITKHGEEWHREIDKLVQKLKAEVDEMKNTQLQTLQKQLDEINKTMSDIKDEINSVDSVLESTDISSLFSVPSTLDRYTNLPRKITISIPKFIPKKLQADQLFSLETILLKSDEHDDSMKTTEKSPEAGSSPPVKQLLDEPETVTAISTEYEKAESSPPVKQLLDEPETVTTIHIGYRELYRVACLSDEEIWTRGKSNTMKLYSINQGSELNSITTKSGNNPTDIAVTKSGDLVFTDRDDRTVNIVKNEKIEEVIRLQNWRPWGVCSTSSGDLLVIMDSDDYKQTKVVRYSGSTEKQTIQFDDKGNPLYSSGGYDRYITENRNLDICVSDNGARTVVVVNQAGKLRFRYTGYTPAAKNQPFNLRGITTDSQSHILTADDNNDCVHIIDKDGQFLRYIDCEVWSEPQGLCTDTNDNLFVAQQLNSQVMKIKYLQ
ncbi:E3 ubiquitin-protein ligase TRIM71-like [Saccostrea cucullata]|uniref:E3 ubiquitin-protein ligase TRIM71-like n=1 Tax=Saccostrea cuccullata TaxID=36930 RepID=UPI002ED66745